MRALLIAVLLSWLPQSPAPQADAVALFERGTPWTEWLDAARSQRDLWLKNVDRAKADPGLVERLRHAAGGLQLLVVAEAACSDSVSVLPYLATLASAAGVDLRIVNKPTGLPLIESHRTPDGRTATPTVLLLRHGAVVAAWVERPAVLQTWFLGPGQALTAADRLSRKMSWYDWDRGDSSLAEIVALVEAHGGGRPLERQQAR